MTNYKIAWRRVVGWQCCFYNRQFYCIETRCNHSPEKKLPITAYSVFLTGENNAGNLEWM